MDSEALQKLFLQAFFQDYSYYVPSHDLNGGKQNSAPEVNGASSSRQMSVSGSRYYSTSYHRVLLRCLFMAQVAQCNYITWRALAYGCRKGRTPRQSQSRTDHALKTLRHLTARLPQWDMHGVLAMCYLAYNERALFPSVKGIGGSADVVNSTHDTTSVGEENAT
jgi:hypothetical protein